MYDLKIRKDLILKFKKFGKDRKDERPNYKKIPVNECYL